MNGKRLYEMTVKELEAAAQHYEGAGNEMWAQLCREQISLNYRIAQAFRERCARPLNERSQVNARGEHG